MLIRSHLSIRVVLLLFFTLCVGFWSCNKKVTSITSTESSFIIGSGGGVSGQYIQYKVFDKGEVKLYDFKLEKYIPYSTLSTSLTEKMWAELETLKIQELILDDPGNYNYYIEVADSNLRHKIQWSDESKSVPIELKEFFQITERALREMK